MSLTENIDDAKSNDMSKLIFEQYIDVNKKSNNYPIISAAFHNDWEIIKLLVDAGADLDVKVDNAMTVFDYIKRYVDISDSMLLYLESKRNQSCKSL